MTPGQLVKAVAMSLEVPEETIVVHDRNLVVAGLRTKSGRGLSAAKVTPLDAARLLVATLGSARTKHSVQTVREFESAVFRPMKIADNRIKRPPLAGLPDRHNFIDALVSLIKAASAAPSAGDADQLLKLMVDLAINCSTPNVRGTIELLDGISNSENWYEPVAASKKKHVHEGMWQSRGMRGNVILMIGLAFRENGFNYPTAEKAMDAIVASYSKAAKTKKDKVA
jgi:hypothetical protein